jgi:cytochrome P450
MGQPYPPGDIVSAVTTAPQELGIDLMDGAFYGREPHDAYAWMRAHSPVYYDEANDLWAAASYAAVKTASVDTEAFSSALGIRPKYPPLPMMIDFDHGGPAPRGLRPHPRHGVRTGQL